VGGPFKTGALGEETRLVDYFKHLLLDLTVM
jgi:hypothetical protein